MPTILVVGDDAETCHNMTDWFGDRGYATETAENGDTAPFKAGKQPYDLDLRMPGMNGPTFCQHLERLQPPIVAMMVAAHGGADLDQKAQVPDLRHVLLESVNSPRLLALVEQA
jgi:CheY-like chemotaxis protein